MLRYIIKRILLIIPVLIGVSFLVFTIMFFTRGEPAYIILGANATEDRIEEVNKDLGLDKPFIVQYGTYMYKLIFKFDMGKSYITGQSISRQILERFPYTLRIGLISAAIAAILGITLGVLAASHQYSLLDNISMFASLFFVSMPQFWLALTLVSIFANKLGLLPAIGVRTWKGYILPCAAMALSSMASIARQTRSSMLEVIRQDFIVTARAKGQTRTVILTKHALRNALFPIVTSIGELVSSSLMGALIVETIFSIQGLGTFVLSAINNRDYPAVLGSVIFIAFCFSFCILITDIVYALIDPRIKSQYARKKQRGVTA